MATFARDKDEGKMLLQQIIREMPLSFYAVAAAYRIGLPFPELAAQMQEAYRESTPPAEFREDKLKKMGENPLLAPVVIACVMERHGGAKIPEIEEIEAVACALQNLQLSATAAGLGGYWSSPPVLDAPSFRDWLGIRAEDRCVGLIYLGWPKPSLNWPRSVRQPVETKIVWRCTVGAMP